ncbi:DUF805 domain-containing protein [Chitinimonas sp. BJB300]|uniref:DUF805 domain-containing protein n=1 Tax=Chitinimonas sp. BJB300 TaxID=1559339 RepID=UPI000C10805D|nr:DUF805 domain-containing protein [Chitinimonas sp. BJB300]PHV11115.1 hypothetical protein CSQ89_12625 [Chitinimonas sp. BJB300]TSJ88126.1 DUF805 domain-containing protein [Chitinimonas sp. BJB300]
MSDSNRLLLSGRVLPGFNTIDVANSLARLFKVSEQKAHAMLSGSETVIKRSLQKNDVARYLKILTDIGAEARIEASPTPLPIDATNHFSVSNPTEIGVAKPAMGTVVEEVITCPACQLTQSKCTLCRSCSADMPRMLAARTSNISAPHSHRMEAADENPTRLLHYYQDVALDEPPSFLGFSYEGRINRMRYMTYSVLIYAPILGLLLVSTIVEGLIGGTLAIAIGIIGTILLGWLVLRTMALRLHDLGLSGKWLWLLPTSLLMLLTGSPIAAAILGLLIGFATLVLCVWPGQRSDNLYGSPNGTNSGGIIFGAVLFVVVNIVYVSVANQPTESDANHTDTTVSRLAGPIYIEESDDPAEQEALVRKAINTASEKQGITLDDVAREAAVQAYLQQIQQE